MDNIIQLKTERLNSLLVKEMMYRTNGYETPEYITKEIKELKQYLKDIVGKGGSEIPILATNK